MRSNARFARYISLNVFAQLGMSAYLFADTLFISRAAGSNGITALNLVLPLYGLLYALGLLSASAASTRWRILKSAGIKDIDAWPAWALVFNLLAALPFVLAGLFCPSAVLKFMGADSAVLQVGTPYIRIFLLGAPSFVQNHMVISFVRNDDDPSCAMAATFSSCIFNIIFDYIFAFPLGMGIAGTALATVMAPGISTLLCLPHFLSTRNSVRLTLRGLSPAVVLRSLPLGIPSAISELSPGVTTLIFNILLLRLSGSTAVAAYGVVANISLIVLCIFNGIAQGSQPLFSDATGRGFPRLARHYLKLALCTATVVSICAISFVHLNAESVVSLFNSEGNTHLAELASPALRLYTTGFLFCGCNVIGAGYLSATAQAVPASVVALLRGLAATPLLGVVLAHFLGITGVWLIFPAAEGVTLLVLVYCLLRG